MRRDAVEATLDQWAKEKAIKNLRGHALDVAVVMCLGWQCYDVSSETPSDTASYVLMSPKMKKRREPMARHIPWPWPLNVKTYYVPPFHQAMYAAWELGKDWLWSFDECDDWLAGSVMYADSTEITHSVFWDDFHYKTEAWATLRSTLFVLADYRLSQRR